jgi:hypothetical protein
MNTPLQCYIKFLEQLFYERAIKELDQDREEYFMVALSDCRKAMTPEEQAKIESIVDKYIKENK